MYFFRQQSQFSCALFLCSEIDEILAMCEYRTCMLSDGAGMQLGSLSAGIMVHSTTPHLLTVLNVTLAATWGFYWDFEKCKAGSLPLLSTSSVLGVFFLKKVFPSSSSLEISIPQNGLDMGRQRLFMCSIWQHIH